MGLLPSNLCCIVLLQKRVVRILNKSKFDAHTDSIFKEFNIMKFHVCLLQLGQFMFSYQHKLLPKHFDNLFATNSQIHSYGTRNTGSFQILLCRTNICQFSIRYQGPI